MTEPKRREPEYFIENGVLTRRTFVEGAGFITIASALGFGGATVAGANKAHATDSAPDTKEVHACCTYNCTSRCFLKGTTENGRLVSVEPGEFPGRPDYGNACLRSMGYAQRLQDENARVMYPMRRIGERGEGKFERITWDEAIDEIAGKLQAVIDRNPRAASFYSFTGNQGKMAWEACTRFAGHFGGTSWDIEGIMGDHGASMGMQLVYGQTRGGHDTRDYLNSNLIVMWGRNVADTHTQELRYLIEAREKGAKVIVVDPRQCSTAAVADQWIPIRPQTDPALALGMMRWIIEHDLHDAEWLKAYSCAPYLVRDGDGQYLKDADGNYLCWNEAAGQAVPMVAASSSSQVKAKAWEVAGNTADNTTVAEVNRNELALRGTFTVDGVACRTAFDHLIEGCEPWTLDHTAEITGIDAQVIEQFAHEYAAAKPAAIRMGQGMQRVFHSHSPFRTVATLAAVCGYVGEPGGGASHMGGMNYVQATDYKGTILNYANWKNDGGKVVMEKSSYFYDAAIDHNPVPIDFLWIANSNLINMSPDANKIVNEVLPAIDYVVTVDPFWTWTAKYSDMVLPGNTYWENWDVFNRDPWIMVNQPSIAPMGESKSDPEIMTMLANKLGFGEYWDKTDEEWVREFVDSEHPGMAGFNWDDFLRDGIFLRADGLNDSTFTFKNKQFKTKTGTFEFYTESLVDLEEEVPCYKRMAEDPESELGQKYPLVFIQYHDRLNVHSQQILADALAIVQAEPLLQMNPADAQARGLAHGDVAFVHNDRGSMKTKVFLTEAIVPGICAMASGWTPDHFIEGEYQELTHYRKNETEEKISQTSTAFYDVLVEVEKA